MRTYVIRRVLLTGPTLLLVAVATFALVRLQPGDAIIAMAGEAGVLTNRDRAELEAELGLDHPAPIQFFRWLAGVLKGDLGESFYTRQPVTDLILHRLAVSAELVILSLLVSILIAIPLGVAAAYWRDSPIDYAARLVAVGGLSMPDFWFALLVIIILVTQFQWLPPLQYRSFMSDPGANIQQFVIPAAIVGYRYASVTARMTRSAVLEVLNQDYVRTARAKGLDEFRVVLHHVGRNAVIPVVTIIGTQVTHLFNALVVIEIIFALPGLGSMTYDAVLGRDYPVVQGTVLLFATVAVAANLLVDLSYAMLDPRVRL